MIKGIFDMGSSSVVRLLGTLTMGVVLVGLLLGCGPSGSQGEQAGTPAEQGKALARKLGCLGCHSTDGSRKAGPTFQGLYGKEERLTDGTTVRVDEDYLKESILDHGAKVVAGYQPVRISYEGRIDEAELEALLAFLRSLAAEGAED